MKNIFLIIGFILSFNAYADNFNQSEFESEMKKYASSSFSESMLRVDKYLAEKDYLNPYKKYLLMEKALMVHKMALISDKSDESKLQLTKDFMILTVCVSYNFKQTSDKEVRDLLNVTIGDDENLYERYRVFAEKVYSEDFLNLMKDYIKNISSEIADVCSKPLDLKDINKL